MISLSYKVLRGTISIPQEDKIMYQTCNIDGLVKISPHAVFYMFHTFISLLVSGAKYVPPLPAKALLCMAVYVSGLTVLEKRQTQSKIAKTIGHVSHDSLNQLAGILQGIYQQMVIHIILLITGVYSPG